MKLLCVMILSIVSATNLLADDAAKQSDEYFKKTLVGTWQVQRNVDGVDIHYVPTFLPNGQVDIKGKWRYPDGTIMAYSMKSSWKIKNGVLITKIESVSQAHLQEFFPIGHTWKERIIAMDKKTFHLFFLSDSEYGIAPGAVSIFHRVKS